MDCLESMYRMDKDSVDLVLVDLPYGTTANAWDAVIPFKRMWKLVEKVCKKGGAIVMTSAQPFTTDLIVSRRELFKYTWVWRKNIATASLNAKKRPMKCHEDIVVFCDGVPPYYPQGLMPVGPITQGKRGLGTTNYGKVSEGIKNQEFTNYPRDVLDFNSASGTVHPTQKPIALMEYLICTYSKKGDVVLDFTMGSGTTICAALNMDRRSIGIEMDPDWFDVAKRRIENHPIQRTLF